MLCFDGGTEGIRAGIIDQEGKLLSVASAEYPTYFPKPGWAEQKPSDWWSAFLNAARLCLEKSSIDLKQIKAISLDATTCTIVPLGKDKEPIYNALLWMDVRASKQAAKIFDKKHFALNYSLAGVNAEWMPPKMLWLLENEPEIYQKTEYLVEYTDWLIYKLTGQLVLNINTITQRWFYNSRKGGWPKDFFDEIGLIGITNKFPQDIIPVGVEVGNILPEIAKILGLSPDIKVFQGGGDAFIGLLGLNVTQPGKIGLITGSSNVIGGFVDHEFHGQGIYGAFPDAVIPGLWLIEGGQVSTGSILAWFKRNFARDLPSEMAYKILDQEAAQFPPGSNGIITLDYFQGNRTPYTDSKARGAIWGLSLNSTRGQIFRSLMEGIAFGTKLILDTLAVYGHITNEINVCGGATRSDLFMQIYADVCNIPISVVKIQDAPLLGDAVVALTGLGLYKDFDCAAQSMVAFSRKFEPNLANHKQYDFYYDLYKKTYQSMRTLMHQNVEYNL